MRRKLPKICRKQTIKGLKRERIPGSVRKEMERKEEDDVLIEKMVVIAHEVRCLHFGACDVAPEKRQ